jgi:hypothetical protein
MLLGILSRYAHINRVGASIYDSIGPQNSIETDTPEVTPRRAAGSVPRKMP